MDMETDMSETCETCRFYKEIKGWNGGICRCRSPIPTFVFDGSTAHYETYFPTIGPNDWCGEHQPKEQDHDR